LNDVSTNLAPGKFALVADISEESVSRLDARMENLGGQVFRAKKQYVEMKQMNDHIATLDADISQLNKDIKDTRREQKANLHIKIEKLKEKRQKEIARAKERSAQMEKERDIKVQALKEKAANARGKTRAAIEARVTEIKNDYQKALKKWKNKKAEKLERKAKRLQQKAKQKSGKTTSEAS
jgi:chromosome segregation ATPase